MTREALFDWAEAQNEPYEFDGFQPVAMTGGTLRHTVIIQNVAFAFRPSCRVNAGLWGQKPASARSATPSATRTL